MKKFLLVFLLLCALTAAGFTQAQQPPASNIGPRDVGIGFLFGVPTGITAKLWIGRITAVDVTTAWNFADDRFEIQLDYLFHYFGLFRMSGRGQLPLYIGIGPRVTFDGNEIQLGGRLPLGISYLFPTVPIELFAEVAPGLAIFPATKADISGGFGVRYYF